MNMNQNKQTVTCPKCTHQFNADELLYRQIEDNLRQSFATELANKQAQYDQLTTALNAQKLQLDYEKQAMQTQIAESVQQQVKSEKMKLEQSLRTNIKADLEAEAAVQIQTMRNELNEQSEKLRDFNKVKAEIERLTREKNGLRETIEAESESKLSQRLRDERQKIEQSLKATMLAESADQIQLMRNELNEQSEKLREFNKAKAEIERLIREKDAQKEAIEAEAEAKLSQRLRDEKLRIENSLELKMRDKDYEIDKLKNQIQESQRVAEQGSTQAQGEVQELAIEEWLHSEFPFDEIEEIKKGQRGADCIQIIHTRSRQNCGKIYYESKRTLEFGKDWIDKFKVDLQAKNIHIGVLVTQAMPKDMARMGLKEGIYICTYEEFKGLSAVLRQSIIEISNVEIAQEFKGEKMAQLYDFLTSNEFKSNIQAIVESFIQMEDDLNKERRTMESLWKQREKQIRKVMSNTSGLYGSIRGIAGNAIQSVPQLESSVPVIESTKPVLVSPPVVKSEKSVKQDSLF